MNERKLGEQKYRQAPVLTPENAIELKNKSCLVEHFDSFERKNRVSVGTIIEVVPRDESRHYNGKITVRLRENSHRFGKIVNVPGRFYVWLEVKT